MPTFRMRTLLAIFAMTGALTLSLAVACLPGDAQDTQAPRHLTVTANDHEAARSVVNFTYRALPTKTQAARPAVAKLNQDGAAGAHAITDAMGTIAEPLFAHPDDHGEGHHLDYFPADVQDGTGPDIKSATQHNLYVNLTGTVANNWGDPEGYLSDLNESDFIRITDQYVHRYGNDRYPVGASPIVTYPPTNPLYLSPDIYSILHAAAVVYGSGTDEIYHVFLVKGQDVCLQANDCYSPDMPSEWLFCGTHGAVQFNDIGVVIYTLEPYQDVPGCQEGPPNPNGELADSTYGTLGVEVFDTITDPLGTGWTQMRMDTSLGAEIGEECEIVANSLGFITDPSFKINGKLYQSELEYSNKTHNCTKNP